jgi:hypothetical protein
MMCYQNRTSPSAIDSQKCRITLKNYRLFFERQRTMTNRALAEREGFEPPIRLPVCRISSAVLSTAQPPLQDIDIFSVSDFCQILQKPVATQIATEFLFLSLEPSSLCRLKRGVEPCGSVGLHSVGDV